ncbi:hypothetical protein KNP414_01831 [Paenibacillus mucilaginosus KNP414]|uniref:Uncharacterized protein n=1 Tax=Paenibacillus mucilaginosus (strain KNP414) TaxID=1036673 RepID=F8FQN8_PAEMK|nr:hypothetical protein KNP414_01831 [Paenibacillus mucilaginosus KNP414]
MFQTSYGTKVLELKKFQCYAPHILFHQSYYKGNYEDEQR